LSWFWNDWYFKNSYIDLRVARVTSAARGFAVIVDNLGGMPAPFDVVLKYADGTAESVHQTPAVWRANQKQATITVAAKKKLASLTINGGIWMDADPSNNTWTARR